MRSSVLRLPARFAPLALAAVFAVAPLAAYPALPGFGGKQEQAELLPPEQAFSVSAQPNGAGEIQIRLTPAKGYYLYQKKTWFALKNAAGVRLGEPRWLDAPEEKNDPTFGQTPVYRQATRVVLPVQASGKSARSVELVVGLQGCNEPRGVCYPPQQSTLSLKLPAGK